MHSKRRLSAPELLLGFALASSGVVTACAGGDGASSAAAGGSGARAGATSSGGAGVAQGGVSADHAGAAPSNEAGATASEGGVGATTSEGGAGAAHSGAGGVGGSAAANNAGSQSVGGDEGLAGDSNASAGSSGSLNGAGGEAGAVDTSLKQPVYPAAKFPPENPDSDAKDMLGKILFWDEHVGSDDTMACGTCHRTGKGGGSDPRAVESTKWNPGDDGVFGTNDDIHGSQGIKYCTGGDGAAVSYAPAPAPSPFGLNRQITSRRAPTYLDAMFAPELFWDGRASGQFVDPVSKAVLIQAGGALESQSVGPPMNAGEMACAQRSFASLLAKLASVTPLSLAKDVPPAMQAAISAAHGSYTELFAAAFPGAASPLSAPHFAFAIATHERHLQSDQTPWDRYNQFLNDPRTGDRNALTPAQVHGFELFMGKAKCGTCHIPPFFSDFKFHNLHFVTEKDLGRQALPGHAGDPPGQVKTANLRNVGLREAQGLFHYGYGPGLSLDAVLAWYNIPPGTITAQDIAQDPLLASVTRLDLTTAEIADILDFLRNGLTDPRVKNQAFPFDRPTLSSE